VTLLISGKGGEEERKGAEVFWGEKYGREKPGTRMSEFVQGLLDARERRKKWEKGNG